MAVDYLFTNKSDGTIHYILIFVRITSPDHIEVGSTYQKTKKVHGHNNELELFNEVLQEFRKNTAQSVQLHIDFLKNFHDGSLISDNTLPIISPIKNIVPMFPIITNNYQIWLVLVLGLGLCVFILKYYRYWPSSKHVPPSPNHQSKND